MRPSRHIPLALALGLVIGSTAFQHRIINNRSRIKLSNLQTNDDNVPPRITSTADRWLFRKSKAAAAGEVVEPTVREVVETVAEADGGLSSIKSIAGEGGSNTAAATSFTLSFGNVEFRLAPEDAKKRMATSTTTRDDVVMSVSKISNGEVTIDLNNFSGSLRVVDNGTGGASAMIVEGEDANDVAAEVEVVEAANAVDEHTASQPVAQTQPQSKAAIKFEDMLSNFRQHSEADFNLVSSPRYRGLLRGTSAAINDPKVILAFRVLYEDLGPIRMAGDLIFSKLERELQKAKATDGAMTVKALGRDDSCVVAARKIFDAVDADASGTVSSSELLESDLLRSLGQCSECTCGKEGSCESVLRFMDEIDKTHPNGELHFDEFLLASHSLLYGGDANVALFGGDDTADDLVDEILNGREGEIGKEKADRYAKRFDGMCDEFDSWDSSDSSSKAQSSNPRLALVLDGCFAGSRNPPVVDALKVLYVDFRPLRMAGDLIFKMMRKLARG